MVSYGRTPRRASDHEDRGWVYDDGIPLVPDRAARYHRQQLASGPRVADITDSKRRQRLGAAHITPTGP
jgi:hypothetical protein